MTTLSVGCMRALPPPLRVAGGLAAREYDTSETRAGWSAETPGGGSRRDGGPGRAAPALPRDARGAAGGHPRPQRRAADRADARRLVGEGPPGAPRALG